MKTIHLICNAHLDPIWLWPWHAGMAEVLSTARSVCDQLDECDDLIFTRGESWFYQQVQKHDAQLFARIKEHVANGRWEIVGGWYIQPDCNLPSYWGLQKQIELGKAYFQAEFDQFPQTAYNVDTFGHAATLPRLIHEGGQKNYIMMRPQEVEMHLPSRVFRWQGENDGPIVTTFRIARAYCTPHELTESHVRASLEQLPEGIDHTMCFIGLGDHGGGPSRLMTQWCRDHADAFEDVQLVFSSPSRFFAAIEKDLSKLPLVQGELQYHAVGCYSIDRRTKILVRQADHALRATQSVKSVDDEKSVKKAWEYTCFHHFHDTLGGTCIPSAYPMIHAQLGNALATCDELLRHETLQRSLQLGIDHRQRIVLFNPSPVDFDGYVQVEPWLEWNQWKPQWQLQTVDGTPIPHQVIAPEALVNNITRITFACHIDAGSTFIACINQSPNRPMPEIKHVASAKQKMHITNNQGTELSLGLKPCMMLDGVAVAIPHLCLQHDSTDTWSHGIDRYDEPIADQARIDQTVIVDKGPLLSSIMQYGCIGESPFEAHWQIHAQQQTITLDLHIEWVERHRVLKLVWDLPAKCTHRLDGIPGSVLKRLPDAKERPVRDLTQLHLADGHVLGMACPDVFALDGSDTEIRLTLLRSAIMAHHDPHDGKAASRRYADRGAHDFHFVFTANQGASIQRLEQWATQHWLAPLMTDLTLGMPERMMRQ